DAAALSRGVQTPALASAEFLLAVPYVAHGDGDHRLAFLLHFQDRVDVLLAAAANAEEANADLFVRAQDAVVAGRRHGEGGGPGRCRLEELAAMDLRACHETCLRKV